MTYPYQPPGPPEPAPPPPDPPIQAYGAPFHYAPYQYVYQQPGPPTDGLAIASLVLSCAAVLGLCAYGIGSLLGLTGAILGHVARHRITRSGAGGAGLALAGIIVGWVMFGLGVLSVVALVGLFAVDSTITTG